MKIALLSICILFTNSLFAARFISPEDYKFPKIDFATATLAAGIIAPHDGFSYTQIKFKSQQNPRRRLGWLKVHFYESLTPSESLVFVMSGIGGDAKSETSNYLASEIIKKGHHAVVIPSVFTKEFANSYSSSGYVGLLNLDSEDMIELLVQVRQFIEEKGIRISSQKMVGFSLGALTAAHLSEEAAKLPGIEFDKVVMINPPVDLIYGLRYLDKAAEHRKKMSTIYFLKIGISVLKTIKNAMAAALDLETYTNSLNNFKFLTVEECNFFIAESLGASLKGVVEASQDAFDLEVLPPKPLSGSALANYDRSRRNGAISKVNFEGYIQNFVVDYFKDHNDGTDEFKTYTLAAMNKRVSMVSVAAHIRSNPRIFLMTNVDDFLLRGQSDVDYLSELFGDRATFYPRGGHIGNMWYKENMDEMFALIK